MGVDSIFNSWIKSIVLFTIFFSLILFLLPDEKYRKYIQTAIGFVMVIIVINPIISIGDLDDYMSFDYYYEELGASLASSDEKYYTDLMEGMIEDYLSTNYSLTAKASIEFDTDYRVSNLILEIKDDDITEETFSEIEDDLSVTFNITEVNFKKGNV